MTARGRALPIFLVAIVVVGICSVVFADAATAPGDPCGRTHVWAQGNQAPQTGSVLIETVAVVPEVSCWTSRARAGRLVDVGADDRHAQTRVVEPSAPRAPPLA